MEIDNSLELFSHERILLQVSVRLPHSEYKHVPPVELELIVIANLIIIPSEITIMTHDSFKYKIMHVSLIC